LIGFNETAMSHTPLVEGDRAGGKSRAAVENSGRLIGARGVGASHQKSYPQIPLHRHGFACATGCLRRTDRSGIGDAIVERLILILTKDIQSESALLTLRCCDA
jgi:hypothetical protein